MATSRLISTSRFQKLVSYTIQVDGERIPETAEVLSIVVHKEVNRITNASLILVDGNAAEQDFPLSNEDIFVPGKPIEIASGYDSDDSPIFKGIIVIF